MMARSLLDHRRERDRSLSHRRLAEPLPVMVINVTQRMMFRGEISWENQIRAGALELGPPHRANKNPAEWPGRGPETRSHSGRGDAAEVQSYQFARADLVPSRLWPYDCSSIIVPMKPFLAAKGHSPEIVNRMYGAWWKAMILQATLWIQPYIREGDF